MTEKENIETPPILQGPWRITEDDNNGQCRLVATGWALRDGKRYGGPITSILYKGDRVEAQYLLSLHENNQA